MARAHLMFQRFHLSLLQEQPYYEFYPGMHYGAYYQIVGLLRICISCFTGKQVEQSSDNRCVL